MADYRNSSGIVIEDGPTGPTLTIEDSSRVDPGSSARRNASPPTVPSGSPSSADATDRRPATDRPDRPPHPTASRPDDTVSITATAPQGAPTTMSHDTALVDADWAQGPPRRSDRPLRRGRRRHHRLRAEPHPGRDRLELDQPAGRRRSAATSRRARTSASSCPSSGISPDTTIVLYGDNNNWFAAWAYWQLKLYGHRDVRILDGGRKYWLDNGLPLTTDVPAYDADRLRAA